MESVFDIRVNFRHWLLLDDWWSLGSCSILAQSSWLVGDQDFHYNFHRQLAWTRLMRSLGAAVVNICDAWRHAKTPSSPSIPSFFRGTRSPRKNSCRNSAKSSLPATISSMIYSWLWDTLKPAQEDEERVLVQMYFSCLGGSQIFWHCFLIGLDDHVILGWWCCKAENMIFCPSTWIRSCIFDTFLHLLMHLIGWNKLHPCYWPIIHYWKLLDCQRVCCNAGNNLARLLT